MTKVTMSFRTENSTRDRLARLAAAERRDRSFLINEAVEMLLDRSDWQEAQIRAGIEEADRGEFATEEEVEAVFAKWRNACA